MQPELIDGHGTAKGNFKTCLDYVLREDALAVIVGGNMGGETASQLAAEFEQIKPSSGKGKNFVWHVSFSAAPGEQFSQDKWRDKGERLFNKVGQLANRKRKKEKEIGLNTEDNQFVIIYHPPLKEGDLPHIHIVGNRARFDGKLCYCSWSIKDLHVAAAEIEIEDGLRRCDHLKFERGRSQKLNQEKDPRDLRPRVLKRLEKKEERTGETDPRLQQYQEMIKEQRQEIERQQHFAQVAAPLVMRILNYYKSNRHQGNAFTANRDEEVVTLVRNVDSKEILKAMPKADSWEVLPTLGRFTAMDLELLEKTQKRLDELEVEERRKRNKVKGSIDFER